MNRKITGVSIILIATLLFLVVFAMQNKATISEEPSKLAVLWTSGDPEVAEKVCLMYTHAAKKAKWFDEVVLIVWGPSSKLLSETPEFQTKLQQMQKDGVTLKACIVCANMYGVADQLRELGLDVKGMGEPLSTYLKQGWKTLTF